MIAKMTKVYVVAKRSQSDRLLDALGGLGVVHLAPVEAEKAVAEEKTISGIDRLNRAIQLLSTAEKVGERPAISPLEAADEALDIQRDSAERRSRLSRLHQQLEHLAMWGDVRLEQFERLHSAGIEVKFYSLEAGETGEIQAEFFQILGELSDHRVLIGLIDRTDQLKLPDSAEQIELPDRDRPSIRDEAAQIDAGLRQDARRLTELSHLVDEMRQARDDLDQQASYTIADRGALKDEHLFALQGWVPAEKAVELPAALANTGIEAAVQQTPPDSDDEPPTLIRYPRWARPMKAMFDTLGTIPGYKEADLSGFFMIAMPIFVAMLIGDGGYGLLFTALSLAFYRKVARKAGRPAANLILVFSITTVIWGALTANYFGVTPGTIASLAGITKTVDGRQVGDVAAMVTSDAGGWAAMGRGVCAAALLYRIDPEAGRNLIIKISFVMGCIHLVLAQLRQAAAIAPNVRFVANIGWSIVLPGMLGVIWQMFFIGIEKPWSPWMFWLIGAGAGLVLLFSHPSKNPAKMLGLGLIANIMPLINTFSDTMSYIRLMAVGLASYYIAYSFNLLGSQVASGSHWSVAIPILLFGHALNIGLAIIAVFAHGVRLNMLEFSSNAGVQWAGYAYQPFTARTIKES